MDKPQIAVVIEKNGFAKRHRSNREVLLFKQYKVHLYIVSPFEFDNF